MVACRVDLTSSYQPATAINSIYKILFSSQVEVKLYLLSNYDRPVPSEEPKSGEVIELGIHAMHMVISCRAVCTSQKLT